MKINEYLKKTQPVFYKNIVNILQSGKLSHSYLIVGKKNNPLKKIAIFLAQSLVCDYTHPLACEECLMCQKIEKNQYMDLIMFDGQNQNIKKDDADYLISSFAKTPMEMKNKNICIIHLVEKMTIKAANSLLKFLEEPNPNTYVILTTENEKKIIPTIISRSQKLYLNFISQIKIINACKQQKILLEDAEILSYFYSDADVIKTISENQNFIIIKKCCFDFIQNLGTEFFFFTLEKSVIPKIIDKNSQTTNKNVNLFLDLLLIIFENVFKNQNHEDIILTAFNHVIQELSKINHIENFILEIINLKGKINNNNINISSALEHLAIFMKKIL